MRLNQQSLNEQFVYYADTLRYVAVFSLIDMDRVIMNHTKEAFSILTELEESLSVILSDYVKIKNEKTKIRERVHVNFFSDHITLVSAGNTNLDCVALLTSASRLMSESIAKHILISGHISYGHFYLNEKQSVLCGKPYIQAKSESLKTKWCGLSCDTIVEQNVLEARMFTHDETLFKKMGQSLIQNWEVPVSGGFRSAVVKQEKKVINWVLHSLDVFNTIREYQLHEFYHPFSTIYGPYEQLDDTIKAIFEETLSFMNSCLSESVRLYNVSI